MVVKEHLPIDGQLLRFKGITPQERAAWLGDPCGCGDRVIAPTVRAGARVIRSGGGSRASGGKNGITGMEGWGTLKAPVF